MNIAITIPCREQWYSDFGCSLASIIQYTLLNKNLLRMSDNRINFAIVKRESATVTKNKHFIVEEALKLRPDKILMVDADMIYPPNLLIDLLNSKKLVIGCNCTTRKAPIRALAIDFDDKPILNGTGISKVKKLPGGVLLIDSAIFARIDKPYFDTKYLPEKNDWLELDYYFSEKLTKAGIDLWCHHGVSKKVYHIGSVTYGL